MTEQLFHINGKYHYILREHMRENLMKPQYSGFVRWYRESYDQDLINLFKKDYYLYLQEVMDLIPFPEWFITTYNNRNFSFLNKVSFLDQRILVLENNNINWKTPENKVIQAIHPPTTSIVIEGGSDSKGESQNFEATAFLLPVGDKDSSKIIKQNNFYQFKFANNW